MFASGEVADFTPVVVSEITTLFANLANVPASAVSVNVSAASVRIAVSIAATNDTLADEIASELEPVMANATAATTFLSAVAGVSIAVSDVSRVEVDAPPPPSPPPTTEGSNGGAVAGIVVAVLVALFCVGYAIYYAIRKQRRKYHAPLEVAIGADGMELEALTTVKTHANI